MSDKPLSRRARRAQNNTPLADWLAEMPEGLSDEEKAAYEEEMAQAARRQRTRRANSSRRAATRSSEAAAIADATPASAERDTSDQHSSPADNAASAATNQTSTPAEGSAPVEDTPTAEDTSSTEDTATPGDAATAADTTANATPSGWEELSIDPELFAAQAAKAANADSLTQRVQAVSTDHATAAPEAESPSTADTQQAAADSLYTEENPAQALPAQQQLFSMSEADDLREDAKLAAERSTETMPKPLPTEAETGEDFLAEPETADGEVDYTAADDADADEAELEVDLQPLTDLLTRPHQGTHHLDAGHHGRELDTATLNHSAILPQVTQAEPATQALPGLHGNAAAEDEDLPPAITATEHPVAAESAHGLEPQEQSRGFDFGLVSNASLVVAGIGIVAFILALILFLTR